MEEQQEQLIVEGFLFASEKDAKLASSEVKKIEYINKNINYKNIEKVRQLYEKMLEDKQFRTPVGWTYLLNLRNLLIKSGMAEDELRPIPTYFSFSAADPLMQNLVKQRVKPGGTKLQAAKNKLTISVFINILLLFCVAAMFYIAMKSDSPNMINYRQNIVNQYSSWEQDLTERENEIRAKERELKLR